MRTQGVAGLYAGLPAFFVRCVALVAAQMTTYDWAKAHLVESPSFKLANGPVVHFAASAVAAGAACVSMQVTFSVHDQQASTALRSLFVYLFSRESSERARVSKRL